MTNVIIEILDVRQDEGIPLMSHIPKSLVLQTRTLCGPLDLAISEPAAVELVKALSQHLQIPAGNLARL